MLKVNLSNWRQKQLKQRSFRFGLYLFFATLLSTNFLIIYYYHYHQQNNQQKSQLNKINAQINNLKQHIATLTNLQLDIEKYNILHQQLKQFNANKLNILHLLTCLTETIPEQVWIEKIDTSKQKITLEGISHNYLPIIIFSQALTKCQITEKWQIDFIELNTSFTTEKKLFTYQITASWNNNNEI